MMTTIKSYKGFNKDLTCRGFQYEVGKEYECDNAKACDSGFHACENPIDIFAYYTPAESFFHEVEQSGTLDRNNDDSKIASTKIKIGLKIDIKTIVECGIKFIYSKVKWSDKNNATGYSSGSQATGNYSGSQATGNYSGSQATGNSSGSQATGYSSGSQATGYSSGSQATGDYSGSQATGNYSGSQATGDYSGSQATGNYSGSQATGYSSGSQATGDYSGSQATGDYSGSQATGNYAMSSVNGYASTSSIVDTDKIKSTNAVALGIGINCKAKAPCGCWLVLAESQQDKKGNWNIIALKSTCVDDKKIKSDTFYTLKNGEFVEVK